MSRSYAPPANQPASSTMPLPVLRSPGDARAEEHSSSYLARRAEHQQPKNYTHLEAYLQDGHHGSRDYHKHKLHAPAALSGSWSLPSEHLLGPASPEPAAARDSPPVVSMTRPVDNDNHHDNNHHDDAHQAGHERDAEEIRELECELERILQRHLREHDKISLSFYLNEFETGACNLADLLGFLIGRLLITVPSPVIRYRLLVCIKRLYVEPKLASSSSWPLPYGLAAAAAPGVGVEASGQLDLRLFEATCRRYLLASNALLSGGRLQELERDELRRRRRQRRAAQLRHFLDPSVGPHEGQLAGQNRQQQQQQEEEEELMLRRGWRRRRSSATSADPASPSHFWQTTTGQLKPALPVRAAGQRHRLAPAAWKELLLAEGGGGESDPRHWQPPPPPPQQQQLLPARRQEAIVPGQANNTQGVYFPGPPRRSWGGLEGATKSLPLEWPLSGSPRPAASEPAASGLALKWLPTGSHKFTGGSRFSHHDDLEEEEEDQLHYWLREYDEPPPYSDALQWAHAADYGLSYGAFPGDNEAWPLLQQAPLCAETCMPVHDNDISSNSLNTHPPLNLAPQLPAPNSNPPPHHKRFSVANNNEHLLKLQTAFASTASLTPSSNNNNNHHPSYYDNYHNYNNTARRPSHNDLARKEPLPDCCQLAAVTAPHCSLCQLNQVDGGGAGAASGLGLRAQQDTLWTPEQQLKAISLNEIYPAAPYESQLHKPASWPRRPPETGDAAGFYCGQQPPLAFEPVAPMAADNARPSLEEAPHFYSSGARIRVAGPANPQRQQQRWQWQPLGTASITGSDKLVALAPATGGHRSHRGDRSQVRHQHHHHHRRHHPNTTDQRRSRTGTQQKDYWLGQACQELEREEEQEEEQEDEEEEEQEQEQENDDPADEVLLVPAQARDKLPMSVAEQMKRQADSFVSQFNRSGAGAGAGAKPERRHKPSLQVRRTLKVRIKKSKPILGIAIEGGFNVSGQLLPRIVCVHEQGSAYQCGKLRASDLILEVNGKSTVNMTHDEIARTIAAAYYQNDCPYIEFLIGESVQTG